jgi:UDP-N-acetyl-D-galactosamine dehydrogenase
MASASIISQTAAPTIRALGKPQHVLYDLKYLLPAGDSDLRL